MLRPFLTALTAAGALAALAVIPRLSAQTAAPRKPDAVDGGGAAAIRTPRTPFVPPRTTWGDPDISGNLTNANESNTPFERPDEFAGKRLDDVTPEQLAEIVKQRKQKAVEDAPFVFGNRTQGIAIAVPIHWLENLDADNSRPWFVVDPPDGKIPALTQEAVDRVAAIAKAREGRSVADSFTDRSLGDRCISRRGVPAQAMTPGLYGNSYQILQTKEYVAIRYEMDGVRIIPIEGRGGARSHVGQKIRSYFGDAVGRWDGNTLVVDTTNFLGAVNYRGGREGLHLIERLDRKSVV